MKVCLGVCVATMEPEPWRWSSYRHYACGERGTVLVNEQKKAEPKSARPDEVEVRASHPSKSAMGGAATFMVVSTKSGEGWASPAIRQVNPVKSPWVCVKLKPIFIGVIFHEGSPIPLATCTSNP